MGADPRDEAVALLDGVLDEGGQAAEFEAQWIELATGASAAWDLAVGETQGHPDVTDDQCQREIDEAERRVARVGLDPHLAHLAVAGLDAEPLAIVRSDLVRRQVAGNLSEDHPRWPMRGAGRPMRADHDDLNACRAVAGTAEGVVGDVAAPTGAQGAGAAVLTAHGEADDGRDAAETQVVEDLHTLKAAIQPQPFDRQAQALNTMDQHPQYQGEIQFGCHEHHRQRHAHAVQHDVGCSDPKEARRPSTRFATTSHRPKALCLAIERLIVQVDGDVQLGAAHLPGQLHPQRTAEALLQDVQPVGRELVIEVLPHGVGVGDFQEFVTRCFDRPARRRGVQQDVQEHLGRHAVAVRRERQVRPELGMRLRSHILVRQAKIVPRGPAHGSTSSELQLLRKYAGAGPSCRVAVGPRRPSTLKSVVH